MYITPRITASDSPFLTSINTGLGNVLFQAASCYGLAKKTGRKVCWNRLQEFAKQLQARYGFNHRDTIFRNCTLIADSMFHTIKEESLYAYNQGLVETLNKNTHPIELHGYLECTDYFNPYRDEILELFSPDETSLAMIQAEFPILFDAAYTPVSIHFRGNEYLRNSSIRQPWSYEFYRQAIHYIQERVTNPMFLIFSDDMDSIDPEFLNTCTPHKKMGHKYDYIDLWCLSLCKHNIISRSTFGFWGAYFNTNPDKIVLYNKKEEKPFHRGFIAI